MTAFSKNMVLEGLSLCIQENENFPLSYMQQSTQSEWKI